MRKVLSIIVLCVVCLIGFNSCQSGNNENIHLDLVFPLTGNGAAASEATINAINLCVDKWNAAGGINGYPIKVECHDSKGQTKEAINIARKITSTDNANIVISAMSTVSLGMLPILEEHKIIHLAFSGANSLLTNNPKFVIRGSISPKQIGEAVIKDMTTKFSGKDLIIFYCNNEFGQGYLDATLQATKASGLSECKTIGYDESDLSYRNIILKAGLSNNNVLFVIGQQESLGRLIKQIRESGYDGIILSEPNITSASTLSVLSKDILNNVYYISVIQTDKVDLIRDEYYKKHHQKPSELALDAYNNTDLILTLYEKINGNPELLKCDSLMKVQFDGLFGPTRVVDSEIKYNLQLKECIDLIK